MNSGKRFEKDFKDSIEVDKVYYQRIKDSPSSFGQDSNKTRFTLRNDYDGFMFYEGFLFPIELKSCETGSVSIQKDKTEKGKSIKLHQIQGLFRASQYERVEAGFIFKFIDQCYWLDIKDFLIFEEENGKKSINLKDVIKYNGIKINGLIKKINYRYEVTKLLDEIIQKKGEE